MRDPFPHSSTESSPSDNEHEIIQLQTLTTTTDVESSFSDALENRRKRSPSEASDDVFSVQTIDYYERCGNPSCCCLRTCCDQMWWLESIAGSRYASIRRLSESYVVSPKILFGIRLVLCAYTLAVLLGSVIIHWDEGYWFFYFTHLSYLGLTAYFVMVVVLSGLNLYKPSTTKQSQLNQSRQRDIVCTVLYTVACTFHLMVPITYWTLLGDQFHFETASIPYRWVNLSVHGLDFFIIFVEFCLNKIIYTWGHFLISILLLFIYICWIAVGKLIYPTAGRNHDGFPYFFLNFNTVAPLIYIPILVAVFSILWTMVMGAHWLKVYVARRYRVYRLHH